MGIINDMIQDAISKGYKDEYAEAYVCQDLVLLALSKSSLSKNVTIKGGVVMRNISKSANRATRDIDLDFIRYPLNDKAIMSFVEHLNCLKDIKFEQLGESEELKHQDYHGKRIFIKITDFSGDTIESKIDIGVHKDLSIEQEDYCFDIACFDEGANLLINSKEQMFTEKLTSLLKLGYSSVRFKDVFDMCYLGKYVDKKRLYDYINTYILSNHDMKENNMGEIINRISQTFENKQFQERLNKSKRNWISKPIEDVFREILELLKSL